MVPYCSTTYAILRYLWYHTAVPIAVPYCGTYCSTYGTILRYLLQYLWYHTAVHTWYLWYHTSYTYLSNPVCIERYMLYIWYEMTITHSYFSSVCTVLYGIRRKVQHNLYICTYILLGDFADCSTYGTILQYYLCHTAVPMVPYCGTYGTILQYLWYHTAVPMVPYCSTYCSTILRYLWYSTYHTAVLPMPYLWYHTAVPMVPYCSTYGTVPYCSTYGTVPYCSSTYGTVPYCSSTYGTVPYCKYLWYSTYLLQYLWYHTSYTYLSNPGLLFLDSAGEVEREFVPHTGRLFTEIQRLRPLSEGVQE